MPGFNYSSAGRDVLGGLSQAAQAQNAVTLQKGQDDMALRRQQFAQQYALQGLQNQMAQQQQGNSLMNERLSGLYGSYGNLLRGLFD
jgi:hypothetical protein